MLGVAGAVVMHACLRACVRSDFFSARNLFFLPKLVTPTLVCVLIYQTLYHNSVAHPSAF